MDYKNVIALLLIEFPDLKEKLDEDDYLSDLPHCILDRKSVV